MRGIESYHIGQAPRIYSFDRKVYGRVSCERRKAAPIGLGGCFGGPAHVNAAVSPLTIIKTVTVTHWYRADLGITLVSGKVSAWNDQVGSSHLVQATTSKQLTYAASDSTFGNKATMTSDALDDDMGVTVNLSGSIFIASVIKLITPANSAPLYGNTFADGNFLQTFSGVIYQSGPGMNANNDGAVAAMTGNWARYFDRRQNNVNDYIKCGNRTKVQGTACTLTSGSQSFNIGGSASNHLGAAYREIVICNGEPNTLELSALDAYFSSQGSLLL